ncbi:MAG: hypothetical protein U0Y82_16625 [Thermoleophilia bacterium]
MSAHLANRLQMLLAVAWLDAGRPEDGRVELSLDDAAERLDLADDRASLLTLMGALGALEDAGDIAVEWTGRGTATVTLTERIRRDLRMEG